MSSGFVSAGGEDNRPREGLSQYDQDAWAAARQKIEELKKPQQQEPGTQEGGKSLYEHLQAQKAAKQEAFEEASKLRNQFRPLDDSEVAFLEGVRSRERAEASSVRKETEEQLAAFRREKEAAEEKARDLEVSRSAVRAGEVVPSEQWVTTKKRRRGKDDDTAVTGKVSKTSAGGEKGQIAVPIDSDSDSPAKTVLEGSKPSKDSPLELPAAAPSQIAARKSAILVAYDSDSDD